MNTNIQKPDTPEISRLKWLLAIHMPTKNGIVESYKRLAVELGTQLIPPRTWSWNYLHSVVNSKSMNPSKPLLTAINQLYAIRISEEKVTFEESLVIAPVGYVPQNTIISTRAKLCMRSGCDRAFIPNSPRQKYCSPECKKLVRGKRIRSPAKPKVINTLVHKPK